jgi:hypothetical protein
MLLAGAIAILGPATAGHAHHSFAATYDESETVEITGKMVQFSFRNPHSFVQVEVTEETGATVRYAVEWAGTAQLRNTGVENDTLRYGDTVVINGNPGRNPADRRIRMRTVTRPDGFSWGTREGEVVD